ncbi:DoxX family protein [Luteimonas kalidii]|uniref:DoxX family protein n=1 Tax=Luteimonas kalidii TaxID=3042025 RepID=A0ABT6JVV0_9GAMM|nr:DoxX family protein [Luteimonas kalidii]MDH5834613.1 DoxX family protein [Luteimonas kalidii]
MHACDRVRAALAGPVGESLGLLAARIGLAVVFWRSGRTKVVEGSWLQVSDSTRFLFAEEYAGVPLPADLAATLATWGEFALPLLLLCGLATPVAAAGILAMTLVIQVFVYPAAWPTHLLWSALALVLLSRGGGMFSLDAMLRPLADRIRMPQGVART